MTILEAINKVDNLKPNAYDQETKIGWLSEIDGIVKKEIIDTHEGGVETVLPYDKNTSLSTELLIYSPYDDAYVFYLMSKIDYANGETIKYNNDIIKFQDMYSSFRNHYNKNNVPLGKKIRYF